MEETLTPEQIKHWRQIIAIQICEKAKAMGLPDDGSYGIWAMIMPESEVIAYWKKMKLLIEGSPEVKQAKVQYREPKVFHKKKCDHSNSIKGSKGRYCLDCEMYV